MNNDYGPFQDTEISDGQPKNDMSLRQLHEINARRRKRFWIGMLIAGIILYWMYQTHSFLFAPSTGSSCTTEYNDNGASCV